MHRIALSAFVSLVVLLPVAPARAQETADSARLYKEGWRLYEDKQYSEACPLLERSLAAAPTIRTRGAVALCYEASGRLASAWKTWRAVADQAKDAGAVEAQRGKRAAQKMEQLRPRIAMVVLQLVESPGNVLVSLDGQPLAAGDLGVPVPVDAGAHTLEAKAAERVDWRSSFEIGKADEGQTRSLPVGPLARIEPVARVETPTTTTPPAPVAAPIADETETRKNPTFKWIGIGAAGAGVVALAVGGVFALSAKSKWNDAKDMGCNDDGVCPNRAAADLVDDANSKATVSTVSVVAGVALVAGGTLLWVFAPREKQPRITPEISTSRTSATFSIRGSF